MGKKMERGGGEGGLLSPAIGKIGEGENRVWGEVGFKAFAVEEEDPFGNTAVVEEGGKSDKDGHVLGKKCLSKIGGKGAR